MDKYELQVWNPTSETRMKTGSTSHTGAAAVYFNGDNDNRRVVDADTRAIVMQPDA